MEQHIQSHKEKYQFNREHQSSYTPTFSGVKLTITPQLPLSPLLPSPLIHHPSTPGELFQYCPTHLAFESSHHKQKYVPNKCILVGGSFQSYTKQLTSICHEHNWTLIQPFNDNNDDTKIEELINYLAHFRNGTYIALIGQSMGCQSCINFMNSGCELVKMVKFMVLQGAVSGREYIIHNDNYEYYMKISQDLCEKGNDNDMMPRTSFWMPITAGKYLNIFNREDDYFSSDLSQVELNKKLLSFGMHYKDGFRILIISSEQDENVPSHIDKELILQKIQNGMNSECKIGEYVATSILLPTGDHKLSNHSSQQLFYHHVDIGLKDASERILEFNRLSLDYYNRLHKRRKIVNMHRSGGDWVTLFKELKVPKGTAYRWVKEGDKPKSRGGRRNVKVQSKHKEFMEQLYRENPGIKLTQICEALTERFQLNLSPNTVSKHLRRITQVEL